MLSWKSLISTGCAVQSWQNSRTARNQESVSQVLAPYGLHGNMDLSGIYLPGWWVPSCGQRPHSPYLEGDDNIITTRILMESRLFSVSLITEPTEKCVLCRETRAGFEESAPGISMAIWKTRNGSTSRANSQTISCSASALNLASNPASETTYARIYYLI